MRIKQREIVKERGRRDSKTGRSEGGDREWGGGT